MNLKEFIREIPDFPKKGILFRDITPLLLDSKAFNCTLEQFVAIARDVEIIAGIESRGFIFAAPVAHILRLPFVILRKPGKLPYDTHKETYDLEYGTAELHVHKDIPKGKALIIDDVLATGGTALASCKLLEKAGCEVVNCAFLMDLNIGGKEKLPKSLSIIEL